MANPIEDESLNEWIEIFNNDDEAIDVKGWMIADEAEQDVIIGGLYGNNGTIIPPYGFAIITDYTTRVYDNFNVSSHAIKLYVEDDSIGNGLKNTGESLSLFDNNSNLIDTINYNETDEGKSLALFENRWYESLPTPGYDNELGQILNCDWTVDILTNGSVFTNDNFEFKIYISKIYGNSKNNLTLHRWVEDSSGSVIKDYEPLEVKDVLDHRTYTNNPNLEENRVYTIKAEITSKSCPDIDSTNNYVSKPAFITKPIPGNDSYIEIIKLYDLGEDHKAKWGQTIKVRVNVYKGDTNKNSISSWIEKDKDKVSKESKFNTYNKFSEYNLTIPLQLEPNCKGKLRDGEYKIVVEGLDRKDSYNIEIEGITESLCERITEKEVVIEKSNKPDESESNEINQQASTQAISQGSDSNKITGNVIYESSDIKAKNYGIYIFSFTIIIVLIYFVLKR